MDKSSIFFNTLTPEILSPLDYTDWDAIKDKVKRLRREIALVQSLDKENPLEDLTDLLNKEPKVLSVLQLLIAHTPKKIYFDDLDKYIDFKEDQELVKVDKNRAEKIAELFIDMGLVKFLSEIQSVEDLVKGVLLGLEPNTRKNRRGAKLETILEKSICTAIENLNGDKSLNCSFESQMFIDLRDERKKIDYVILFNGKPKIGIEVNFYSTSGSKPSEILGRAYPEVQANLETHNMGFIVITDGFGWLKMKPVIQTAFGKLHYLMNINQVESGHLEKAILEIISQ